MLPFNRYFVVLLQWPCAPMLQDGFSRLTFTLITLLPLSKSVLFTCPESNEIFDSVTQPLYPEQKNHDDLSFVQKLSSGSIGDIFISESYIL